MENTAEIFFDYNWPIVTNTVTTTVSQLGTNDYSNHSITLYPNPVQSVFTIKGHDLQKVQNVVIYNVAGQQVLAVANPVADQQIDISGLNAGTYFVKVTYEKGKSTAKLIKL
jgi:uncharacterized protein YxjI